MQEKELISKIQALKEIKPNQQWVSSVKTNILGAAPAQETPARKGDYVWTMPGIISLIYGKRKLAYSFAVLLFVALGVYSFTNFYSLQQTQVANENATASLLALQAELQDNMKAFKEKSVNLAEVVKRDQTEKIDGAIQEAKVAVETLTDSIKKDPNLAKTVASEISNTKTYLSVIDDEDLKESSDDLLKTIDEQLIYDLEKATLTPDQQKSVEGIVHLVYEKKQYADGLESILMLNAELNAQEEETTIDQPEVKDQGNEQLGE